MIRELLLSFLNHIILEIEVIIMILKRRFHNRIILKLLIHKQLKQRIVVQKGL